MIAELNKWVQSKIDFEIGIVALDSENFPKAIESFRSSVEKFQNAAALYNLGVCYEEGFGVERDREKVRQDEKLESKRKIFFISFQGS